MGAMCYAGWILLGVLCFVRPFCEASEIKDESTSVKSRHRRSILNLSGMVQSVTGRSGTDFLNYGNWCGFGGEGEPLDPIDECCQNHDICYDLAKKSVCSEEGDTGVYHLEYKWRVADDETAVCDDEEDKCKLTICICDAIISNCLKSNMDFYNSENYKPINFYDILESAKSLSAD